MINAANYMIIPELKLILECCKGHTKMVDAVKMKKDEVADPAYSLTYNVIADFREFEIEFKASDINLIKGFVDYLKSTKSKCNTALLTSTPHQVVLTNYLKDLSIDLPISFEIFSTLDSAINFVGYSDNNYNFINQKLIELNRITV